MESKKGVLDIVYATDSNYLPVCSTSVVSLCSSNRDFKKINIHILTLNLTDKEISKFKTLERKFENISIFFYKMDEIIREYEINNQGFSLGAYLRLFMGEVLSTEIKKILYLDGDTLVIGNLLELWEINMEDNFCGGILDPVTLDAKTRVGLRENDKYFNTGVLLINLEKWRNEGVENKLIDFLRMKKGNVFHHDQGLINAVIRDWVELNPKFDLMGPYLSFNRKQLIKIFGNKEISSQEDIDEAKKSPIIIHDKLWARFWIHPYKRKFRFYNNLSPFGKPIDKVKKSQKINNWLQHFMPFSLYKLLWQWQWKRKIIKKGQI